jgi:hypothetical protein
MAVKNDKLYEGASKRGGKSSGANGGHVEAAGAAHAD